MKQKKTGIFGTALALGSETLLFMYYEMTLGDLINGYNTMRRIAIAGRLFATLGFTRF